MGDDLADGKCTLPLIRALKEASKEESDLITQAITFGDRDRFSDVAAIVTRTSGLTYTKERVIRCQKAKQALRILLTQRLKTGSSDLRICQSVVEIEVTLWPKPISQRVLLGVQQRFSKLTGVTKTAVGYMGGTLQSPDYRSVCTGQTGHAEVVEVEYDPTQIDFSTLMSFFEWHDPTQVNRQGPDVGTQYRTAIFPQTDTQRVEAQQMINQLNQSGDYSQPIATTIESADFSGSLKTITNTTSISVASATAESKIGSRSRHWRSAGIGQAVAEHLNLTGNQSSARHALSSVRQGQ